MEYVIGLVGFIKVFLLFLSLCKIVSETFRLYKSASKKVEFNIGNISLWLLAMSIAYVLTLMVI